MAKTKTKQLKLKRKTSSKYGKLLAVAAKELLVRKKALIQAERNLARAKQKHEELISEVARLDMVERSLRAMVEGTEPPTNIKYVYQYPQWVWYPYQQYVYTTPPQSGNGYWYNGTWQSAPVTFTSTCQNLMNAAGNTTIYTTNNAGSVDASNLTSGSNFVNDAGLTLTSTACGSSLSSVSSGASLNTLVNNVNFTNAPSSDALVVDLSTGAEPTDAPIPEEAKAEVA